MLKATYIIRFVAKEDGRIHLGQLVDTSRDVGLDSVDGIEISAYLINGSIFSPEISRHIYTVQRLLSPISMEDCNFIRCLGLNYVDHAEEGGMTVPAAPVLFTKPRHALADPFPAVVAIPKAAQDGTSDYEAELCVIIGKTGRNIPEAKALDYILGYTCSNDISARTYQLGSTQWSFSKGLDGSCPLGPVLVAKEAILDPQDLNIKASYNGSPVQNGNTRNMIFQISKQISYLSQGTTIEAGTVFLTGTPAGIGFLRKPRVVLEDGDDIRVWVEKIGTLVNKVRYEE